jgi:NAD(P) transhydrogenase subunit alpha
VAALLASLTVDGAVVIDPADEVHAAVVVCHDGALTAPPAPAPLEVSAP